MTTKIYGKGTKLAEVVHSEGKADPNAPHTTEVVKAPSIEKYLKHGVVEIEGADAESMLAYGQGTAQERGVAAAYEAIQQGRQLIDLRQSVLLAWKTRDCQRSDDELNGVPPVAVIDATLAGQTIVCAVTANQNVEYLVPKKGIFTKKFSMMFEALRTGKWGSTAKTVREGRARAPHVPPYIVTRVGGLENKLLFWEAKWVYSERHPAPSRTADPALLEHIAGDLYAVVATWELTPLEVAALGG